jgi:hypothetical protein
MSFAQEMYAVIMTFTIAKLVGAAIAFGLVAAWMFYRATARMARLVSFHLPMT